MTVKWLTGGTGVHHQQTLRTLLKAPGALPVAGVYDGLSAVLAKRAGFKSLYLSGAALSASLALPDLGLTTMEDVWRAARVVVRASELPVIVDCDTGFGEALNIMRAVQEFESIGVACMQIEDQEFPKKCGHLNDKKLISVDDMCRKIAAARKASSTMVICARTDAVAQSLDEALLRAGKYVDAGADLIFVEAMTSEDEILKARASTKTPLLGNMTEFGKTPNIPLSTWSRLGVNLVIYPVSALRVASRAMEDFYGTLLADGDAGGYTSRMMTRAELYDRIDYFAYEELDNTIARTILETP
jgi:methylisocitrate lyase